eukprot:Clim_evm24s145 gene=Clim_evmTU24s145
MAGVVVVTGASQGFGQAITCAVAAQFKERGITGAKAVFRLTARLQDGLQETKDLVLGVIPDARVYTICIDMNQPEQYGPGLKKLLTDDMPKDIKFAHLFNFASSVGDLSKSIDEYDLEMIRGYLDLNFSSFAFLTKLFVQQFRSRVAKEMQVVNLSSMCAVAEFPGWGLFCAIKAGRDMLIRVLSREIEEYKKETGCKASLKTLNYAPGPLDSTIQFEVRARLKYDALRNQYEQMHAEGKLIKCLTSADRLLKLMDTDYDSGSHVDFYDDF